MMTMPYYQTIRSWHHPWCIQLWNNDFYITVSTSLTSNDHWSGNSIRIRRWPWRFQKHHFGRVGDNGEDVNVMSLPTKTILSLRWLRGRAFLLCNTRDVRSKTRCSSHSAHFRKWHHTLSYLASSVREHIKNVSKLAMTAMPVRLPHTVLCTCSLSCVHCVRIFARYIIIPL